MNRTQVDRVELLDRLVQMARSGNNPINMVFSAYHSGEIDLVSAEWLCGQLIELGLGDQPMVVR